MSTHKTIISYAKTIEIDGYEVKWWGEEGFKTVASNFHLIGKPYAVKDNEFMGFPFFVDFMEKVRSGTNEEGLYKLAIGKIKEYIKSKKVFDGDTATFEYVDNSFYEVQNPEWWEEKYSKTLVPGLRVEAYATHPTSEENKAWRVILRFKSKQGNIWLPTPFGSNSGTVEYFVWIDAKELADFDLPNTQKGAEVLAVQFGIDRFKETKDANGNRNITKISEKNSARYNGKWIKDSLLPDKLTR
jgi:hypothetical protein